jgi:hypothetical protein
MFQSPFATIFRDAFLRRVYYRDNQTNVHIWNTKFKVSDLQYILKYKLQVKLFVLNYRE